MADLGERTIAFLAFFLIFSVLFPIGTFAMQFSPPPSGSLGALNPEALQAAGITLTDAVSYNMSDSVRATVYNYYEEFHMNDSSKYAVTWIGGSGPGGNGSLHFKTTVFLPVLWVVIMPVPYHVDWAKAAGNWSTTYNWTRFQIDTYGDKPATCFITPHPDYNGDIHASLKDGNLTVTIGKNFEQGEPDFWAFAGWWFSLVTGIETQGLPDFFVWLLRLITILGFLSAILLLRSFLPLV